MTWAPQTFLGGLSPGVAAELVSLSVRRQFESGRVILREGDSSSHMELLLSGFAKVTTSVDGFETLLAIRVPGESIGEIGALTGFPRNATVTACGRVVAGVVRQTDLEAFLAGRPEARRALTATIAGQLTWANRRRTDFAPYPAHVRLARVLVDIVRACGRPVAAGFEIAVPLSQPELATMIAVAQATIQKAIQELRSRGLVSTGYRRITVLDMPALQALADNAG